MKVRAIRLGYYGLIRRREGDVFDIKGENEFSHRWMEKVGSENADQDPVPQARDKKPSRIVSSSDVI